MGESERARSKASAVILGAGVLACAFGLTVGRLGPEAGQVPKRSEAVAAQKSPAYSAASIQTHRNLGKAHYEQGKYPEATGEFQKVIASGEALATDHLNLGMALMQANRLDEALGELTTARQMDSKLVAAGYNLGILYKRELRYPDAEARLKRVLADDPNDPAAWFNLGAVYFAQKKLEQALDAHQHVVAMGLGRGRNFYVASLFHIFTILTRLKRQDEAQKVLEVHQQMRDKVPGISLQNPALEGGKYGAVLVPIVPPAAPGRKATTEPVIFDDITSKIGVSVSVGVTPISQPEALRSIKSSEFSLDFARHRLAPAFGGSVAVADYDGDGHPDIYYVIGENNLFQNKGDGTFTGVTEKAGLSTLSGGIAATFADYNNSAHPSLFVAGVGGVTLFRNQGDGTFVDETEKAGLKGKPGELATQALLFDADNDGFLDLVVTTYTDLAAPPQKDSFVFPNDFAGAKIHFYRNNGDGTFTEASAAAGLQSAVGRWRGAVFADFNNDGFADLLLLRDDGPPVLYINQGEGKFLDKTAEAGKALSQSQAVEAHVADFNHDGNFDLALWSRTGYQVLLNRGGAKFEAIEHLPASNPTPLRFARRGAVADVDGDGFDDLLVRDSGGAWRVIANRAGRFQDVPLHLLPDYWPSSAHDSEIADRDVHPLPSLTPAWIGNPGKLNLLGVLLNGELVAFEKRGPPSRWAEVKLNGSKSNTQGVGTIVEFKAGNFYNKVQATGGPVRIFTGDLSKLDVVRVTWPNQIVQNATDVATDTRIEVRESERLASSCPLLYAWNGERYVFVTDVLGVAPLGELAPDGTRIRPYPEEFVRLPGPLAAQDGAYVLKLTDELREVDYFDKLRLVAVDHPAAEEVYANEIYSSSPPRPALFRVREKRFPVSATDGNGRDVLPLIRERDGRYPTDFRRHRILGLRDLDTLTLDLGDVPRSKPIALYLTGWVFWTDSNASRALASSRELQMIPPYLQVRDERGRWVTAIPDMGLPSGTNRTMRVDLTGKFLSSDRRVRIVTNLCVYWDEIFFSTDDIPVAGAGADLNPVTSFASGAAVDHDHRSPGRRNETALTERRYSTPAAAVIELPLISADLHYRGFSTPASDPRHLKPDDFDYAHVLADAPWNPMTGNYTRYGDVGRLVRQADDRLVVMATGDELTLKFRARDLPPPKPGWKRDFFLYARGYAKDGEPNTAFSKTVEPLPFAKMANYPPGEADRKLESAEYHRYLKQYQTRPGRLLIAPLAPPVHWNRRPALVSFVDSSDSSF